MPMVLVREKNGGLTQLLALEQTGGRTGALLSKNIDRTVNSLHDRRGLNCKSWGPGPLGVPAPGWLWVSISIVVSPIHIAADMFMAHGIIYT
jgi:hypothetical protein